jgi:hypothetical protein
MEDKFKRKSFFSALLLKMKDAESYKNYKFLERLNRIQNRPLLTAHGKKEYSFKHSGNAGDIIYSLPAAIALSNDQPIHYYMNIGQKGHYGKRPHPLGGLMLNEKMGDMLKPLLLSQSYITSCDRYHDQQIDFDLDLIRSYPFPLNRGNISRWYFYLFAVNVDLSKPWLKVEADMNWKEYIVISRSQRYQAPGISYSFLKKYGKKVFVGVEAEWKEMRQQLPDIEYRPVNDFLELAKMIAGSRLFIGNQSFPFSIAEALKTQRLLEVYHQCPNVNVEGPGANDFCYQPQFEEMVNKLYDRD